jgi:hypothetical protein
MQREGIKMTMMQCISKVHVIMILRASFENTIKYSGCGDAGLQVTEHCCGVLAGWAGGMVENTKNRVCTGNRDDQSGAVGQKKTPINGVQWSRRCFIGCAKAAPGGSGWAMGKHQASASRREQLQIKKLETPRIITT